MSVAESKSESLVDQAIRALHTLLGADWSVTLAQSADDGPGDHGTFDGRVTIAPPGGSPSTELLITARQSVTPREVETQLGTVGNLLAHTRASPTMLVVSPWLSPRVQQELRDHRIGYLDLTGNVFLSVTYPAIHLQIQGASRSPRANLGTATGAKRVTLAGEKAGRIARFLVDFKPPYKAKDIADATQVDLGWVSRLLGALDDQLLIERTNRTITDVDWVNLLRARASTTKLLNDKNYVGMIAPAGTKSVLRELATFPHSPHGDPQVLVTGPYAARAVAPLATGGQLMLYVDGSPGSIDKIADELDLLPVEHSAEVLLIRARDPVVFKRPHKVAGIPLVALSQLVIDSLSGPGRMPAEAEAVLDLMQATEETWRHPWLAHFESKPSR
ncbi:hypothetical protein AB0N89_24460 [Amycolatopsis sp. NPDC089917]|uniref:hypothetical protein n=1 Tax=Amycolatopsis sp. NPDC089917 TaxID=3155187 RepID=UPI0034413240